MSSPSATRYTPTAGAGSAGGRQSPGAWVKTHKAQATGIGAAVGVTGYALYRRRAAGASSSGDAPGAPVQTIDPTTAGQASTGAGDSGIGSDLSDFVSGLSDLLGQQTSAVTDAINSQTDAINHQLDNPSTPAAPGPAPDLPGPGDVHYTIKKGDTLQKIAQAVYGSITQQAISAVRRGNPTLFSFGKDAALDLFAGDSIYIRPPSMIAKPKPPAKKPAPKPPAKKK